MMETVMVDLECSHIWTKGLLFTYKNEKLIFKNSIHIVIKLLAYIEISKATFLEMHMFLSPFSPLYFFNLTLF